MHPQTVIEHFGTWNAAKRAAGLVPRRFATREELLGAAARRSATSSAARRPRATSTRAAARCRRSRSTGTRSARSTTALREAGFDVPVGEERLERAIDQGVDARARSSAGCRSSPTGRQARRADAALLTEWQVYRMFDARRGAWSTFQFLVRERLLEEGRDGRARTGRCA